MPLHKRESVREELIDSVYSDKALKAPLPSTHCPSAEMQPTDVIQAISDELMLDGNARQNLATFCQTWEEPQVHQLMDLCIDKNLIDKDEYPQTAELERRCVHMLADLWNAPARRPTRRLLGHRVVRGLHAGRDGGQVAVEGQAPGRREADRLAEHGVRSGPGRLAQVRPLLGRRDPGGPHVPGALLHGRRADARAGGREHHHGRAHLRGHLHRRPTSRCSSSPRRSTSSRQDTGLDIDIHVDGASGAFLAPFCAPDVVWDFRIPRVKSISTSGHKFGLAPLGVGWVLWRDAADLPEDLIFHVTYLGGDMPVFQINFSRPAGQIVAQYYNFVRLGRDGYRNVHDACYDTGQFLAQEIAQARPVRTALRLQPPDRNPVGGLADQRGRGPGLHALRHRRPSAHPRAGRCRPTP